MKEDVSIMIGGTKFNFRVGAIIECENKVLLQKSESIDFYRLPGGRVKIGESTLEAIQRELEEEIGLKETNYELNHVSENFFNWEGKEVHELYFMYKIKLEPTHPLFQKNEFPSDNPQETNCWINKDVAKNLYCLPVITNQVIIKETNNLTSDIKPH